MSWALPQSDRYFGPLLKEDPRGFQINHLELALRHCKRFHTAVDGGAHIGTWSVAMAQRFERVIAFEPARDTFECLCENVHGLNNVTPFMVALGAVQTNGSVIDDPTRPGNTGARYLNGIGSGDCTIRPLDDFHLEHVDFLKLDVEGYELHALTGAVQTLNRCRPVVMIEVKAFRPPRFGLPTDAADKFLRGAGYREVARARNDRVYVHA